MLFGPDFNLKLFFVQALSELREQKFDKGPKHFVFEIFNQFSGDMGKRRGNPFITKAAAKIVLRRSPPVPRPVPRVERAVVQVPPPFPTMVDIVQAFRDVNLEKRRSLMWLTILCIFYYATSTVRADLGDVEPRQVNIQVGQPLNLTCNVNWDYAEPHLAGSPEVKGNLEYLSFKLNRLDVDRSFITPVNKSAINLYVPEMNEAKSVKYFCVVNQKNKPYDIGVGYSDVHVGYPPFNVTNFRCISHNWKVLNCTFDKRVNYIYTVYNLTYYRGKSMHVYFMELNPNDNNTSFTFQVNDYNGSYRTYFFSLDTGNALGTNQQNFSIDNFRSVRPDPPSMLNVTKREPKRVTISWQLSYHFKAFEMNFTHEGIIRSPSDEWQSLDMSRLIVRDKIYYSLTIDNLYAHMWYDVRIRVKVTRALRDELWSNFTTFQFQTTAKIPDRPPRVDIGSFYVNDHNDIVLYWEQLPIEEQNGNESHYVVSEVINGQGQKELVHTTEINNIMAKFKNLSHKDLRFTIRSANSEGESIDGSTIVVPSKRNRFPFPTELKKYSTGNSYKLTWGPPDTRQHELDSYTIFWCESKTNYPSECDGPMFFKRVNTSTQEYVVNNNKGINLAISANSRNSSSGLLWSMCTASKSDEIGKLNMVWVSKMAATYMEIQWKLECMDSPIVVGYSLKYCPIIEPKNITCKPGTEIVKNITDTTQYNITGLSPYTTYMTTIQMFSKTRTGVPSDPLVNTTMEAAPTAPRNLKLKNLSNTSVTITWDAPESFNGMLKRYEVWINGTDYPVGENIKDNRSLEYEIKGLQTYTFYDIVVVAWTVARSPKSNSINVTTLMGVPDSVISATPKTIEDYSLLTWSPPKHIGGNLDYYEIFMRTTNESNVTTNRTNLLNATSCWISRSCKKSFVEMQVLVRAVNVMRSPHERAPNETDDNDGLPDVTFRALEYTDFSELPDELRNTRPCMEYEDRSLQRWLRMDRHSTYFKGELATVFNFYCTNNSNSSVIYAFITLFVIASSGLAIGVLYKKCKTMSDIKVVLPDALNDINKDSKCPKMGEMIDGGAVLRSVQLHHHHRGETRAAQQDEQERSLLRTHLESSSSSTTSSTANVDNQSQCESHDDGSPREELDSMEESHDHPPEEEYDDDDKHSVQSHPGGSVTSDFNFDEILPAKPLEVIVTPSLPIIQPQTHQVNFSTAGGNSYVQVGNFAKPSQGYTQLSSLKPQFKAPMVTETDETGISGYVTRKQLADFGQRI
ncbi:Cytokine receptor [Sergentomyia squamirostris]